MAIQNNSLAVSGSGERKQSLPCVRSLCCLSCERGKSVYAEQERTYSDPSFFLDPAKIDKLNSVSMSFQTCDLSRGEPLRSLEQRQSHP